MSFLFLITPVQSTGGPIIINRNQFGINVYLISVFYFMSSFKKTLQGICSILLDTFIFNQFISGLISVDELYDWASLISKIVDKNNEKAAATQCSYQFHRSPPPVGEAPEGWAVVYKLCLPFLDFSL